MARPRVHYILDCPNASGNDSLAVVAADFPSVNCSTCIHEMYENGVYEAHDERVWI